VNKDLHNGWYEINDNVATAIDVSKLAQQYEGSESAYILFYRRKGTFIDKDKLTVPSYFEKPILEINRTLDTEREVYEN
jgi:ubiquitin carboxyl-terminal hydrolase 40